MVPSLSPGELLAVRLAVAPVLHRVGDYLLQNSWLAFFKRSSLKVAAIHAALYTLPFLVLALHPWQYTIIGLSHMLIDRYALASVWTRMYNGQLFERDRSKLKNPDWVNVEVDQSMHWVINALAIWFG